jgi:hypothetical protein
MNAVLSALFGGGLVVLLYGLSFIPSASLDQNDDADASVELTAQNAVESEPRPPR